MRLIYRLQNTDETKSMSWAQRLARVFDIDITNCPDCDGKIKIIACIEDPPVIEKILTHKGLNHKLPKIYPARAPPRFAKNQTRLNLDQGSQLPSDW